MPWIRFTETPKIPDDWAHLRGAYVRGVEVEVSANQRDRWLGRGVAIEIAKPAPKAQVAAAPPDHPEALITQPPTHPAAPVAPSTPPAPSVPEFDPTTASLNDVREFLRKSGKPPGPNTSDAKLRETALDIVTRG